MRQCMNRQPTGQPLYSSDCYLLLDGLRLDVPVTAFTLDEHPRIEPLYRGTRHASLIEASPWLIKPSAAGRLLSEHESWQKYGLVLRSPENMDALSAHLRSLISVRLPTEQLAYCRFHDPVWAARLFDTMSPGEFSAWSGPIQEWLIHTDDAWHSYTTSIIGSQRDAEDEGWYCLREEQLEQWQRQEYQHFLERAAKHLGCTEDQSGHAPQRQRIEQLTQQAHDYGLSMEYQILHFLDLAWRFPEEMNSQSWAAHFTNREQPADLRLQLAEQRLFGLEGSV